MLLFVQTDPESLLAWHIKVQRQDRGWSQAELAERLAAAGLPLHATAVTRIESGKRGISLNEFVQIATAFEVSPEELIASLRTQAEFGLALEVEMQRQNEEPLTPIEAAMLVKTTIGFAYDIIREALDEFDRPGRGEGGQDGEHPEEA